jgi:hypothetical protein
LAIDPKNTFALTNKDAILHMLGNNSTYSTYENSTYGIHVEYPSDWTIQESNATGTLIKIATFVSPTGPDSDPTAGVSIYMDKLHNSTITLNNYAHFVAFVDYENKPSYFHAFKLLELSTNSSILAGKSAYTIIGTYQNPPFGLQQLMEVGTIIGDKAYMIQYIADAPRYSDYLPAVQKMIGSMRITSQGNGPSQTPTVRGPNGTWATITAPPGSKINNFTIIPEPSTPSLNPMGLDNTTWSLLNESSGQMGTIKFHSRIFEVS